MKLNEFEEYTGKFIHHLQEQKQYSPHTFRCYSADLAHVIKFWHMLEEREARELQFPTLINRYFTMIAHKKNNKKTVARKISCLRSFEKFIASYQISLQLTMARPLIIGTDPEYFTEEEIQLLHTLPVESLPSPYPYRDQAIIELLYATGIICSELTEIRYKDVNFAEKTVFIRAKGAKQRRLTYSSQTSDKLLLYLEKERRPLEHTHEHLFLNYKNEPLTTRSIQRICDMFNELVPLHTPLTPHKLRHSRATHLAHQGIDSHSLQYLLGLSKLSTEKYIRLSRHKKKE